MVLTGDPGAGKTTTADVLARRYGFVHLDKDVFVAAASPFVTPSDVRQASYAALGAVMAQQLRLGCDVVAAAPFGTQRARADWPATLARELRPAMLLVVHLHCDVDVLERRLRGRREARDLDRDWDAWRARQRPAPPRGPHVALDVSSLAPEQVAAAVVAALRAAGLGSPPPHCA